jgi:hypothetical protein
MLRRLLPASPLRLPLLQPVSRLAAPPLQLHTRSYARTQRPPPPARIMASSSAAAVPQPTYSSIPPPPPTRVLAPQDGALVWIDCECVVVAGSSSAAAGRLR